MAEKLGIDLVWFGVLLAVNMQTSFMHPPFGFALFYLRSVAPHDDYTDRITRRPIAKVTTGQIYWGAVPFVIIQVIMVGLIIAFPELVSGGLGKKADRRHDKAFKIEMQPHEPRQDIDRMRGVRTPQRRCECTGAAGRSGDRRRDGERSKRAIEQDAEEAVTEAASRRAKEKPRRGGVSLASAHVGVRASAPA